jgi:hypothetical protein
MSHLTATLASITYIETFLHFPPGFPDERRAVGQCSRFLFDFSAESVQSLQDLPPLFCNILEKEAPQAFLQADPFDRRFLFMPLDQPVGQVSNFDVSHDGTPPPPE